MDDEDQIHSDRSNVDLDMQDLSSANPSWMRDNLGVRGTPVMIQGEQSKLVFPPAQIHNEPDNRSFPEATPTSTSSTIQQQIETNHYGFKMISVKDNDVVFIDGYVNGVLPTGMGNDDFTLTFGGDGYKAWVEVTYDTMTLAITSRTIAQGPVIPDSTLGNAYFLLGDVSITDGKLTPRNAQCGDINVSLQYGDLNGAPALYFLSQLDDPILLPP